MRWKGRSNCLVGLILVCEIAGGVALNWPRERLLLPRSKVVAGKDRFYEYDWQSERCILLFDKANNYPYPWSLQKVNLLSGQHSSYPAVALHFDSEQSRARDFETSPDGNWLLWTTMGFKNGNDTGEATGWLANLGTGHLEHFPIGSTTFIDTSEPHTLYWMADSIHFTEIDFPSNMWQLYAKPPVCTESINRSVHAPGKASRSKLPVDWSLPRYARILVQSGEHVVGATNTTYDPTELWSEAPVLVRTSLVSPAPPARRKPLALPVGTLRLNEVAFSPRGDRYAVAVCTNSRSPWLDAIHRRIPAIVARSHAQVGIWTHSVDGSQSHEIGHVDAELASDGAIYRYELPFFLRWSPDGRHLAYVYKNSLYVVPAD